MKPDALSVSPMTTAHAAEIGTWTYEGPWSIYGNQTPDPHGYYSVLEQGELVGFFCIGEEARVPGLNAAEEILDVGLGMRPDLVGQGDGRVFASFVLRQIRNSSQEKSLRAVIQSWNERSIRLALAVGFEVIGEHHVMQDGRIVRYLILTA